LPFDIRIVFSASGEELVLCDSDCGEDLEGCGKENGDRVEELNCVDEFVVLRHVEDDNSLGL